MIEKFQNRWLQALLKSHVKNTGPSQNKKQRFTVMPQLDQDNPQGFFDGTNQGTLPRCGVKIVMYLNQNHFFHVQYAPRRGSNMKTEFSILWTLLHFANKQGVNKIQGLGDSKVVIDCACKRLAVEIVLLGPLLHEIQNSILLLQWTFSSIISIGN